MLTKFLLLISVSAVADDPPVVIDPAAVVVPVLAVVLKIKNFVSPTNVQFFLLSDYCDGCNLNSKPRLLLNWWSRTV
jgi:hypothetical protein